jgi:hypothetical protein
MFPPCCVPSVLALVLYSMLTVGDRNHERPEGAKCALIHRARSPNVNRAVSEAAPALQASLARPRPIRFEDPNERRVLHGVSVHASCLFSFASSSAGLEARRCLQLSKCSCRGMLGGLGTPWLTGTQS